MEGGNRKLSTKSDKRGEFVQLGLQSGGYRVSATADKLGTGFADVRVRIGQTAEVTIRLSTVPPGTDPKVAEMRKRLRRGRRRQPRQRPRRRDREVPGGAGRAADVSPSATSTSATPTCRRRTRSRPRRTGRRRSSRSPTTPESLNALATLYNNQKRFDEAAAIGAKAAASAPAGNADAVYNQGIILWNAGKIAEAKVKFEEVTKADPNHADARFQLGHGAAQRGQGARMRWRRSSSI